MKRERSPVFVICELATVLLITILAFRWGLDTALAERGYKAYGGEYLLLLIPPAYYAGKQTILDWITDIRKWWRERKCLDE